MSTAVYLNNSIIAAVSEQWNAFYRVSEGLGVTGSVCPVISESSKRMSE